MDFIVLEETDSTNRYLKDLIKSGEIQNNTTVFTQNQTKGRGRLSRTWKSEAGKSLTVSMAVKCPPNPATTLICALGVIEALKGICGDENLRIKWPNDLIYGSKKLCGILCERVGNFTVVGIGINVNNESFPKDIEHKATSLKQITGKDFHVENLAKTVCESVKATLEKYGFDFSETPRDNYKALCINLGKEVKFGSPLKTGVALDISPSGELVVHTPQGYENISFGDVFVSGIY